MPPKEIITIRGLTLDIMIDLILKKNLGSFKNFHLLIEWNYPSYFSMNYQLFVGRVKNVSILIKKTI